jgi:hypothetical protein
VNEALSRTLLDIAGLLVKEKIPFALIGGIAVGLRGEPRFTADVDLVIGADIDQALSFLGGLEDSRFEPLFPDAPDVVRSAFLLPLRHKETGIKVDLALGLTGLERQLLDRAEGLRLGGLSIPVATAEDLILLKVIAERPRDIEDVRRIVARQGAKLDWPYLLLVGRQLQEALGQDVVRRLRAFQGPSEDPSSS